MTTSCPSCSGRGSVQNPSTHDDYPCSRCGGKGQVPATEVKLDELARRLRERSHRALDAGDTDLATLLRDASTEVTRFATTSRPR